MPAVLTLAMLGIPLKKWTIYSEPTHAAVYTPEHSPDIERVAEMHRQMGLDLVTSMIEIRENPRPGLVNALLQMRIDGEPAPTWRSWATSAWSSAAASTPPPR